MAQAWTSDLKIWPDANELLVRRFNGTLWVVPHRIDSQHLGELEQSLNSKGYTFERTDRAEVESTTVLKQKVRQEVRDNSIPVVLVNEMGILLELYAHCDAVYVGGGFGEGVHSTLEPGFFGLPIACGPNKTSLFPEIRLLSEQGQLSKVTETTELMSWIEKWGCSLFNEETTEKREAEKNLRSDFWKSRTGESKRLTRLIQDSL